MWDKGTPSSGSHGIRVESGLGVPTLRACRLPSVLPAWLKCASSPLLLSQLCGGACPSNAGRPFGHVSLMSSSSSRFARSILNSPSWWCAVISVSKCKPLPGPRVLCKRDGGLQNASGACSFCAQGACGQQIRCRFGTALWKGCPTGQMLLSGYGPASSLI